MLVFGLNVRSISQPRENDRAAIESINAIHDAESRFRRIAGRYGTLDELGPAGANLVGADLAAGVKNGFRFSVDAGAETYDPCCSFGAAQNGIPAIPLGSEQTTRFCRRRTNLALEQVVVFTRGNGQQFRAVQLPGMAEEDRTGSGARLFA